MRFFRVSIPFLLLFFVSVAQAQEDRLQIVGSHSILTDVIAQVAGDAADVTSLLPVGADPHSFTPTPQDLVAVADADIVLINGVHFEEGLMEALQNAGSEINLVVASQCVDILPISEGHSHEDEAEHAEDDEPAVQATPEILETVTEQQTQCDQHYREAAEIYTGVEEDEEAGEDEHAHAEPLGALYTLPACETGGEEAGCDPHVWTDPYNVMLWTLLIRDTLSTADPTNAETYAVNAQAYLVELNNLNASIVEAIETLPEENRILITNHETLGYFAHRYHFEVVGTVIPGASTLSEPGAAEVAELLDLIREEGVPAVFAENTVSTDLAQQVADESGAQFYALYSDSLGDTEAATYLDYMRTNVTTIITALTPQS